MNPRGILRRRLRLGDAIRIKHGYAFPGSGFSDEPIFPTLLTPGNFAIGGGFKEAKTKTFSGPYDDAYRLKPGDIVVTMTDLSKEGDTLGNLAAIPSGKIYLHNQRIGLVEVTDKSAIFPQFLIYFLRGAEYRSYILGTASGSTVRHTSPSKICDYVAHIPDLDEQRAIFEVLGALDDKITANRNLAQTSDRMAAALVRQRVVEDEVILVADVASVTMGSSPPGDSYNEDGNGMVFYQGNRDFGFRSPTNRLWTVDPKRVAEAGDTLLSVRAPVGELNVANEKTCIGRGLASLRSKDDSPSLLFHRLKVAPGLWDRFESGGTVFGSINGKELNSLPIPRIDDGQSLEPKLAELDKGVASAEAESKTLAALRDTLLPRLMSGELRVRDAEAVVADAV